MKTDHHDHDDHNITLGGHGHGSPVTDLLFHGPPGSSHPDVGALHEYIEEHGHAPHRNDPVVLPEPIAWVMLAMGLAGLVLYLRIRGVP